jgi:hypothetical protein
VGREQPSFPHPSDSNSFLLPWEKGSCPTAPGWGTVTCGPVLCSGGYNTGKLRGQKINS